MDSGEKKASDLDLVLLSSTKYSSSVNNWLYVFFPFSILVYIMYMYMPVHLFYALAPDTSLPPQQKRSGKVAHSNYFFDGFFTLCLKKYSVISH